MGTGFTAAQKPFDAQSKIVQAKVQINKNSADIAESRQNPSIYSISLARGGNRKTLNPQSRSRQGKNSYTRKSLLAENVARQIGQLSEELSLLLRKSHPL